MPEPRRRLSLLQQVREQGHTAAHRREKEQRGQQERATRSGDIGVTRNSYGGGGRVPSHSEIDTTDMRQTIDLLAGGGLVPRTDSPCGDPVPAETATNKVNYTYLPFDKDVIEWACTDKGIPLPDNWDGGTLTARGYWTTAAGGAAETFVLDIQLLVLRDGDPLDSAWGAAIAITDTWIANDEVHITPDSAVITPGCPGTPAGGDLLFVQVARSVALDNLGGDARLLGVKIEYGVNALSA